MSDDRAHGFADTWVVTVSNRRFEMEEKATTPCPECGADRARGDESRIVYCGVCGQEWHPGDDDYPKAFVPLVRRRTITNYGLIGPTTEHRIIWLQTPERVAEAMADGTYPNAKLRIAVDGRTSHGTADEVQPVFDALERLLDQRESATREP
jgi:ribosomal protein L37AE/L43A